MTEIIDDGQGLSEQALKEGIERATGAEKQDTGKSDYLGLVPPAANEGIKEPEGEAQAMPTEQERNEALARIAQRRDNPDSLYNKAGFNHRGHAEEILNQERDYKIAFPDDPDRPSLDISGDGSQGVYDRLLASGVTLKVIAAEGEEIRAENAEREEIRQMNQAELVLKQHLGSEYDSAVSRAKFGADKFFNEADRQKLFESVGNSPEFIEAFSTVIEALGKVYGWGDQAKSYVRPKKEDQK